MVLRPLHRTKVPRGFPRLYRKCPAGTQNPHRTARCLCSPQNTAIFASNVVLLKPKLARRFNPSPQLYTPPTIHFHQTHVPHHVTRYIASILSLQEGRAGIIWGLSEHKNCWSPFQENLIFLTASTCYFSILLLLPLQPCWQRTRSKMWVTPCCESHPVCHDYVPAVFSLK